MLLPAELTDLHERLLNWARWAHGGRFPEVRCQSIESRYRSPQVWHPAAPRVSVAERDAYAMECLVRRLPEKARFLIRGYYVHRRNPMALIRKLRVRNEAELEHQIVAALFLLRGVDNPRQVDKFVPDNSLPLYGLTWMPAA